MSLGVMLNYTQYPVLQKYHGLTVYHHNFLSACNLQLTSSELNLQSKIEKQLCYWELVLSNVITSPKIRVTKLLLLLHISALYSYFTFPENIT